MLGQLPLITVGITAYNAEDTIECAVKSALEQNWPELEIVAVDDCSSDATQTKLKELENLFFNFRFKRNENNVGVAASRNRIIEESKGDFIVFFDDDDKSDPERIKKQYERLIEYERTFSSRLAVICHTARIQRYPDGCERYVPTMGTVKGVLGPNGSMVAEKILTCRPFKNGYGAMATCSQMARRSVYESLGRFDESFRRSEDTEFNIRAALAGTHFVGIAEPLVTQTMTMTGEKKMSDEKACTLLYLNKYKEFINSVNSYSFCYGWIEGKYDWLAGEKRLFGGRLLTLFFRHPLLTLQRLVWALPSLAHNKQFSNFYNKK